MSGGPDVFNPEYYFRIYPDILNAFGHDPASAAQHYRKDGIPEGRSPNPFFMPRYYLRRYSDLAKAFGADNYGAALTHWLNNGIDEGRRGSPIFDVQFYLSIHPDLTQAFGANGYRNAYQHWLDHGVKEGRRSVPELDAPLFNGAGELPPQGARIAFTHAPEVLALRDPFTTIALDVAIKDAYQIHKDWQNHPAPSAGSEDDKAGAAAGKRRRRFGWR